MEILFHGEVAQTNGAPISIGQKLPDFTVKNSVGQERSTGQLLTKPTLISVVPDINTRVCSISTKHFNQDVDRFKDINFYTISTNTIEQQKDWCAAEGVAKLELLSDVSADFGSKMGLYIADKKIDARSIWIVDVDGKVLYQELLHEQANEPNYQAALEFLAGLA